MCPRNFVYDNHSIVYGDKKLGKKSKCTLCLLLIYYLSVPNTPFIACSAIVELDLLSISLLLVGTILSFVNRGPGGDTARRKRLPPSSVLLFLVLLCGCQWRESGYPVVLTSVEFQWPLCRVLSIEFQWCSCYSMSSTTPNKVASQYILLAYPQRGFSAMISKLDRHPPWRLPSKFHQHLRGWCPTYQARPTAAHWISLPWPPLVQVLDLNPGRAETLSSLFLPWMLCLSSSGGGCSLYMLFLWHVELSTSSFNLLFLVNNSFYRTFSVQITV